MSCLKAYGFLLTVLLVVQLNALSPLDDFSVIDFLLDVKRFGDFDYLLWMKHDNVTVNSTFMPNAALHDTHDEHVLINQMMSVLHVTVLQMNGKVSYALRETFNSRFVSLVYIDGDDLVTHKDFFQSLHTNVWRMTVARMIFLVNQDEPNDEFLMALFENCWQQRIINVAVIFANYQETATFYRYTHFPEFEIESVRVALDVFDREVIFPDRTSNLRSFKLPIVVGNVTPRVIYYTTPSGEVKRNGPVGHLIDAFAQKYNCTFEEPLSTKSNGTRLAYDLAGAVRNNTVEISFALTFGQPPYWGYSYPFETLNWCLVTPVEADIPASEFYIIVFKLSAFLLTLGVIVTLSMVLSVALMLYGYHVDLIGFCLHDNCLRGSLGQSFTVVFNAPLIVRLLYLQICILGILLTTSYNSYFSAFVTSAPKQPELHTFEDVKRSNLKIVSWKLEFDSFKILPQFTNYESIFKVEPDYDKYIQMRDAFDVEYGYFLPTHKWAILSEQQKVFSRPLVRYRNDMCFFNNIPFMFPMHENTIYMNLVNALILELDAAGISAHWYRKSFNEMIEVGKLKMVDLSPQREFRAMQVEDLQYVLIGWTFISALAMLVFLGEQLVFYRRRIWNHLRTHICKVLGRQSKVET